MVLVKLLARDDANDAAVFEVRSECGALVGIVDIGGERTVGTRYGRGWYVRDEEEGLRFTGWIRAGEAHADPATAGRLWNCAPTLGQLLDEESSDNAS